jgi:UDP-N-acetylglucosamine enolpyruvyl transferase
MNLENLRLENEMQDTFGKTLIELNECGARVTTYDQREADLEGTIHRTYHNVLTKRAELTDFNVFVALYRKHIMAKMVMKEC